MDMKVSDEAVEEIDDAGPSHPFLRRREMWLRDLALYSPKYPVTAREVGLYLAMRMSERRPYTWPSQARIAADLGRKRETVNAALMYLRQDGKITVTREALGHDAGKDPRQFTYRLRMPYDPETSDMSAKRDM